MGRRLGIGAGMAAVLLLSLSCGGSATNATGARSNPSLFLVRDLVPGPDSSPDLGVLATDGDEAFFRKSNEIWSTQGTDASTQRITVLPDSLALGSPLAKLSRDLLITGLAPNLGYEPWRVDSSGASLILDVNPRPAPGDGSGGSSYPQLGTAVGSKVFFVACDGTGNHLFVTDGTTAGTRPLAGPFDGRNNSGGDPCLAFLNIWSPVVFGNRLFFLASSPANGQGLWFSDGTLEGTRQVVQIDPNPHDGTPIQRFIPPAAVSDLVVMGGRMYFRGSRDLWSSDGTAPGTAPVTNSGVFPTQLVASANRLYFFSSGIWTSDGTNSGTRLLTRPVFPQLTGFPSFDMAAVGDKVFYPAYDSASGFELWVTDATSGETRLLRDALPGVDSGWPTSFIAVGSTMYFSADDGSGRRVWESDGTVAGTHRLGDSAAPVLAEQPFFVWHSLFRVRGGLIFAGKDTEHGRELWGIRTP